MRERALLALQLMHDSSLPTGAFTGSIGWESAFCGGALAGAADAGGWLLGALEDGLSGIELPHLARAHRSRSPWAVDAHMECYATVRSWSRASRAVGARMMALAGERARRCHRAVAAGWLSRRAEVPLVPALAAYAQAVLMGQAQVAVRLGALSGDQAVGLIRDLHGPIAAAAHASAGGRVRPGLAAAHELYGLRHESMPGRLFAS